MILYETFRTFRGKALLLSRHQERLNTACQTLGWPSVDLSTWVPEGEGEFRVKVSVYESGEVTRELESLPWFDSVLWPEVWKVKTVHYERKQPDQKVWREDLVELRRRAQSEGFSEILLTNAKGEILEGSLSNVWLATDDVLVTAGEGVLPGVFRSLVLEQARHLGIPVQFRPILKEEWESNLGGLFLTNSIRGIVATHSGLLPPLTQRIIEALDRSFSQKLA